MDKASEDHAVYRFVDALPAHTSSALVALLEAGVELLEEDAEAIETAMRDALKAPTPG